MNNMSNTVEEKKIKNKEYQKTYYEFNKNNDDYKKLKNENAKKYNQIHREEILEKKKIYYQKNKDIILSKKKNKKNESMNV